MIGVKVDMLSQWSQWSRRTGWRVVNIDLDIIVAFLKFRYISFVHEVLIVIAWVVMSGTFINSLHNGLCDHRPYKHGMLYQNQARVGPMLEHVPQFGL